MSNIYQTPTANLLVTYDFPIRPDLIIRIVLPAELTESDAERLCAFVRALAMPNESAKIDGASQ